MPSHTSRTLTSLSQLLREIRTKKWILPPVEYHPPQCHSRIHGKEVAHLGKSQPELVLHFPFDLYMRLQLVAKLFSGTGVGALQFLSPTYIAEICPPRIRGALMVTYSFWGAVGLLIASVALQIMNKNDPENWHIPIFTQFGLLGLMAIFYIIIPESPCESYQSVVTAD